MSPRRRPNPPIIRDHRRQWRDCLYVYPVISRRAKGLSIGVNLNPDKRCTFGCVYCQIDRRADRGLVDVDVATLADELRLALGEVTAGRLWDEPRFRSTPAAMRRVNDIAFSGDGEPTCVAGFDRAAAAAAEVKAEFRRPDVKIVVITNATQFDRPQFQRALPILDAHNGEIWAKLDAGTEAYFRRINRPNPRVTLEKIVDDITAVGRGRAIVIQTLLCRLEGAAPPAAEIDAYIERLRGIVGGGGRIKLVQLHTVARPPAESYVSALPDAALDAIAERVRAGLKGLTVETYYGTDAAPQGG